MKCVALALLLPAAAFAFGQSSPSNPFDPGKLFQMPPAPHSGVSPWTMDFRKPLPSAAGIGLGQQLGHMEIDPRIIVHPPQASFAQQTPREPVSRKLYPNLKLLPVEVAKAEPIPRTWPGFKVAPIPAAWPQYRLTPIADSSLPAKASPQKPLP